MMVKELSAETGIKKHTLDNYLNTHNSIPNAEAAVKIAKALGVTVEYLVTGKESYNEKKLIAFPKDLRLLVDAASRLSTKNRKLALALLKTLKEQEE
jgi:transcriptional regulator with XRE-family HTH domain